jgi:acetate---CoA ligase (ADP-forming)
VLLEPGRPIDGAIDAAIVRLGERLVVKLADVPHRTELGAVRLDVPRPAVAAAVRELLAIAEAHGLPGTVPCSR